MANAIEAVAEIFTWIGFGVGSVLAVAAVVLLLLDGTWTPVRAVVEDLGDRRVVRWFDDEGGVHEAPLTPEQERQIGDRDMVDVFARRGSRNRMRLTRGSGVVRGVGLFAVGLFGLGVVSLAASIVMIFVRG